MGRRLHKKNTIRKWASRPRALPTTRSGGGTHAARASPGTGAERPSRNLCTTIPGSGTRATTPNHRLPVTSGYMDGGPCLLPSPALGAEDTRGAFLSLFRSHLTKKKERKDRAQRIIANWRLETGGLHPRLWVVKQTNLCFKPRRPVAAPRPGLGAPGKCGRRAPCSEVTQAEPWLGRAPRASPWLVSGRVTARTPHTPFLMC